MDPDVIGVLPEPQPYDPGDRFSGAAGDGRNRKRKMKRSAAGDGSSGAAAVHGGKSKRTKKRSPAGDRSSGAAAVHGGKSKGTKKRSPAGDRSSGAAAVHGGKNKRTKKRSPAGDRSSGAAADGRKSKRTRTRSPAGGEGSGKQEVEGRKSTGRTRMIKVTDETKTAHIPASKLVVAHSPNVPRSYNTLIKSISFLLRHDNKGKSYQCPPSQKDLFMRWSRSDLCLFFEWDEENKEMICWMHNICKGLQIKFIVNPAFPRTMNEIKGKRSACAFSSNFVGDSKAWAELKDTLLSMFGSLEEEDIEECDHLFVFTRVGDYMCFRNYQINSVPDIDDSSSMLSLTETSTYFCLKLVDVQASLHTLNLDSDTSGNLIDKNLKFCPMLCYTIQSDQSESCMSHVVQLNGQGYSVFLPNSAYISLVDSLEGFNMTLGDIVEKEPFLKIKSIIGSVTNKECIFLRNKIKAILRSLVQQFVELLKSGRCVDSEDEIHKSNVLVRGSCVRLYDLKLTGYTEDLAKKHIQELGKIIESCFPEELIPIDLLDSLESLDTNPLNGIEALNNDCVLLKAEERRTLLIDLHSEYKTNIDIEDEKDIEDEDDKSTNALFDNCPYIRDWEQTMLDNEYMRQVANWDGNVASEKNDTLKGKEVASNKDVREKEVVTANQAIEEKIKKKEQVSQRSRNIKKKKSKMAREIDRGKLQFDFMRNFDMHMPEKAKRDRLLPFRLGLADYILTAYFPSYLPFVQKRIAFYRKLRKSEELKESNRRLLNQGTPSTSE